MAIVGISKGDLVAYVSDDDPCKKIGKVPVDASDPSKGLKEETQITEGATVFNIGGLDVFMMGWIYDRGQSITRDAVEGEMGIQTKMNATAIEACRFGVRSWENFKDANGNDIEYKTNKRIVLGRDYVGLTDECLLTMGIRLVTELGNKIKEISNVTPADAKNSATAS